MKIELHNVAKGRALAATSTVFATGAATLVRAETEQRPTVLGLIASGRMRPDAGEVLIDGRADAASIRDAVALVDAPDVCDPAPNVTVLGLVEEELMFAGRPSNLLSARRWLEATGRSALGRLPISAVAPRDRIALLLELTALRERIRGMVLVSPDRHGGDPAQWWELVEEFAARGYAMLAIAGDASAMVLRPAGGPAASRSPELPEHPETVGAGSASSLADAGEDPAGPADADAAVDAPAADSAAAGTAADADAADSAAADAVADADAADPGDRGRDPNAGPDSDTRHDLEDEHPPGPGPEPDLATEEDDAPEPDPATGREEDE